MCGIGVVFGEDESIECEVETALCRRGPDGLAKTLIPHQTEKIARNLTFLASVLHIQGDTIITQPIQGDDGCVFVWNGEVFGGIELPPKSSDTLIVFHRLMQIYSENSTSSRSERENLIVSLLSSIHGPYAFVFYSAFDNHLYFGRDPFGRRSLLHLIDDDGVKAICSTSIGKHDLNDLEVGEDDDESNLKLQEDTMPHLGWSEVRTDGIYALDLSLSNSPISLIPWPHNRIRLERKSRIFELSLDMPASSATLSTTTGTIPDTNHRDNLTRQFIAVLKRSITKRINRMISPIVNIGEDMTLSRIGVLFSGGIDSVLLTALLCSCLSDLYSVSTQTVIDLINVSFYDGESIIPGGVSTSDPSPDRLAAVLAVTELRKLHPHCLLNLVHVDVSSAERIQSEDHIKQLIYPSNTHMDLNIGTAFWFASRAKGYLREYSIEEETSVVQVKHKGRPLLRVGESDAALSVGLTGPRERRSAHTKTKCSNSSVACSLVSKDGCPWSLCKRCCISKQRESIVNNIAESSSSTMISAPLRCPVHKLREPTEKLVDIQKEDNITKDDQKTSLDVEKSPYSSSCRVYLIGIGADEQLAGYGRHRTVYQQHGVEALENELNFDMRRLWQRNLGRDDRCVSDNAVEAWFPFLDEEVVSFLQSLSISEVSDLVRSMI